MVGYPAGWEDIIVRGEPADDRFTVVYVKDGRVRAALMVNDDEHFDSWTRLIEARQPVRPSLRDWSVAPLEAAS
jgi:3-phenylpropionate/trans-cinnamate dioxygenase ferredoxin reductase subunit